jgi:hypothetical protein
MRAAVAADGHLGAGGRDLHPVAEVLAEFVGADLVDQRL